MGMLINGKWEKDPLIKTNKKDEFIRQESTFNNTINDKNNKHPAEANRYHLYISYACPWASRALVMLKLKGLDKIISYSSVEYLLSDNVWEFFKLYVIKYADPVLNKKDLRDLYILSDSKCTSRVTVPVLWDKKTKTIVNNESADIMRILNTELDGINKKNIKHKNNYYPVKHRKAIDKINDFVYENINNGVYKCGFATSQQAYDQACDNLFKSIDKIEKILSKKRYLIGDIITEADWRLFTTLVRFDCVYVAHFKCNKKLLRDYHSISNYLRELYQMPGIAKTVDIAHIKKHYYLSHKHLNPNSIIPKGFDFDFKAKHNRDSLR